MKKLMIGGAALVKLGSDRTTEDVDYLINDPDSQELFIHDREKNIDYINANGHPFYAQVWKHEAKNIGIGETASPQALLEMKAFAFVQHCLNANWGKADAAEYDMKFLVRTFGLKDVKIVNNYIGEGELTEVRKVIDSAIR
mgnify:CR=1 FL=1